MTNSDYELIPDDHPIWAERDALMFPDTAGFFADQITESASAMRPLPYGLKVGDLLTDHPSLTEGPQDLWRVDPDGLTDLEGGDDWDWQGIEENGGMGTLKPVPTLCLAVCPSHHWSCAAEQPHGNGAHVCNHGGKPHNFWSKETRS